MKSSVFWDITPCSPLELKRRFLLSLLAIRFHAGFLLGLFFDLEDGDNMLHRNVGWLSTDFFYNGFF
jgi:hypothetical protein